MKFDNSIIKVKFTNDYHCNYAALVGKSGVVLYLLLQNMKHDQSLKKTYR